MEETKEEMPEPSLKLENMHRLSYLESIVQGMSDQLRVIISKQNQLTNFLLKRPSDFSQVLCHLAENTHSSKQMDGLQIVTSQWGYKFGQLRTRYGTCW